jgi:hypothetical protein
MHHKRRRPKRRPARHKFLDAGTARQLTRLTAPRRTRRGLTHGDVCPENLILAAGGVRAIDEERLAIRPVAGRFDLNWRPNF